MFRTPLLFLQVLYPRHRELSLDNKLAPTPRSPIPATAGYTMHTQCTCRIHAHTKHIIRYKHMMCTVYVYSIIAVHAIHDYCSWHTQHRHPNGEWTTSATNETENLGHDTSVSATASSVRESPPRIARAPASSVCQSPPPRIACAPASRVCHATGRQ